MFCRYCGNEISDDAIFCNKCGKQIFVSEQQMKINSAYTGTVSPSKPESVLEKEDEESKKISKSKQKKTLIAVVASITLVIALFSILRIYVKSNGHPLALAAKNNNTLMLKTLLLLGADVNTPVPRHDIFPDEGLRLDYISCLCCAAANNSIDALKLLLKAGADVDDRNLILSRDQFHNDTPLIFAVRGGNIDAVKILVENGADVNAKSAYQYRGAIYCATTNTNILRILVEAGADVNLLHNENGDMAITPLVAAIYNDNAHSVKYLLANGADINAKIGGGGTALHVAAANNNIEIAKILLEEGIDTKAVAELKYFVNEPLFFRHRYSFHCGGIEWQRKSR